ncbi:MAG: [LysW]-lysine hydrolase [Anaerolineae bacterium]|nr:[LysW]-lysine hydrolase [Thermoflexales bacterium]MDW8408037.1 [LysW]-lysine hydrolase [Anaerolineae bacterium]
MIDLLEHCVRIPSLSGQEQAVAEFLRDQMQARGFTRAFIDEAGNAVGVIGDGARQLVMLGHMDTVGGDVPVRYEEGNLYGRGTVDAKGPLCAFVLAGERIAAWLRQDAPPEATDWQIVVVGATEEETATSRGARFAAQQYRPELCIIGEPSGVNGITLGYKGRLLVEARFEMPARHSAVPAPGVNEIAVHLWNWIDARARAWNADKPKAFEQITPSLRSICSGADGLREWCEVLIGFRLPVEFGPDAMISEIDRWLIDSPFGNRDDFAEFVYSGAEQAWRASKDTPLARAFVDAIRAEGLRPAFKYKTGTADFNVVGPAWNVPIVAYGPGDSSLDHTPDEHIAIAEFEQSVRVLERVLRRIIGRVAESTTT